MKYYISDLHFGHENMLEFDKRPFSSLEEMKDTLISNWNSAVGHKDEVYILGDFFWNNTEAAEVLPQLKGKKYLIQGNHDRLNSTMKQHYLWVKDYAEIKDSGRHVVLCHYPIAHWHNADYGYIHLYGHIHNIGRDSRPFDEYRALMKKRGIPYECYNVGCMMPYMGYTPRTLDEIIEGAMDQSSASMKI